ncbi:MAG: HAD family hydrolase [Planctomycetes bacterium]|nr:HAD family hydrolase [Planctomycetota bacterium]
MIKAITFDLWQTLIYETVAQDEKKRQWRVTQVADVLAEAGHPVDSQDVDRAHEQVWVRCQDIWLTDTDLSIRQQVMFFLEAIDPKFTADRLSGSVLEKVIDAYATATLIDLPHLHDGVKEILPELKNQDIKIGLISNTGRTPGKYLRQVLKKLKVDHYFDVLSFSDELLIRKPSPEIFYQTLKHLGSSPAESLHIGDDPRTDVGGAKRIGMKAVLIKWNNPILPEMPSADIALEQFEDLKGYLPKILA